MSNYLDSVKEFHEKFNHPVNNTDSEVSEELRKLRIKLIFEELQELSQATGQEEYFLDLCESKAGSEVVKNNTPDGRDRKEEMDALCDITVVTMGAALALGHHEKFDDAFNEVHRSNMSKMCNTLEEVKETQDWYLNDRNTESYSVKKGDKWIVLRKSDDKILKNKFYSEADLQKFV